MFERFTDRARIAMAKANQEAGRREHRYISAEHVLLGLLKEGAGIAVQVLESLGVDLDEVRLGAEQSLKKAEQICVACEQVPRTPGAKRVVEFAISEAGRLGHNYVGTGHLLLGILCQADIAAVQVLIGLGATLEKARQAIKDLAGDGE